MMSLLLDGHEIMRIHVLVDAVKPNEIEADLGISTNCLTRSGKLTIHKLDLCEMPRRKLQILKCLLLLM